MKTIILNYDELKEIVDVFDSYSSSKRNAFEISQGSELGIGLSTKIIVKNEYDEVIDEVDVTDVSCW